jgi:hypothetical protein
MKKTVIFILLFMGVVLYAIDPVEGGDTSICYIPEQSKSSANLDLCSYMETQDDFAVDICKFAPDIPGFTKKTNTLSLKSDEHMKDFCEKSVQEQAQSAIKDIDRFSKENNFNFGTSSDATDANEKEAGRFFATSGSPKEIMKNSESISRQALYSGNQKVMREVVNYAKNSNTAMSNVKLKDLSAPSDYTNYLLDRKALVKGSFSDHYSQSPLAVTSEARNKVQDTDDPKTAIDETKQITANASDKIDFGTNKRIQLYLDASAKNNDYAIPTQEMVNLLREDLRPEAIANIKQQMKRETLIISELMQIDQARKDILTISGNKAAVITRQFNTTEATKKIDDLIDDTSGGSGTDGLGGGSNTSNDSSRSDGGGGNYYEFDPNNPDNWIGFDPDDPTTWPTGFDPNDPITWPAGFDPNNPITWPAGFDPNNPITWPAGFDPNDPGTWITIPGTNTTIATLGTNTTIEVPISGTGSGGININDITKSIISCATHCATHSNGFVEYVKICVDKCITSSFLNILGGINNCIMSGK